MNDLEKVIDILHIHIIKLEGLKEESEEKYSEINSLISKYKEIYNFYCNIGDIDFKKNLNIKEVVLTQCTNFLFSIDNLKKMFHDLTTLFEGEYYEKSCDYILNHYLIYNKFKSQHDMLKKFNYFQDNVVLIGANGSGKTSYAFHLKEYLPEKGTIIGAQKILIIPTFNYISNSQSTNAKLYQSQNTDKTLRVTYSNDGGSAYSILNQVGDEFKNLLDNLLAERNAINNKFLSDKRKGLIKEELPSQSKLDRTIEIWNSLITHRRLECEDGINIQVISKKDESVYPAHLMSDGEKVALYLIAHVLQAPENGFIIVDEPEIFLHKSIVNQLWNTLEAERDDCIFVYLTHDLDFAQERLNVQKIWLKSFDHPYNWEIEEIPENEIPESLIMELLGSRKNILFCEGTKESHDLNIYNEIFKDFSIYTVGSCQNVINYTKAYNKIGSVTTQSFGLIDMDHQPEERLSALKEANIYSLPVSEVENLILQEDFLQLYLESNPNLFENISEIICKIKEDCFSDFRKNIDVQISNYISSKINFIYKEEDFVRANKKDQLLSNFESFNSKIKIEEWYDERKTYYQKIVLEQDFNLLLKVYNNKGLVQFFIKWTGLKDYSGKAKLFLRKNLDAQKLLRSKFEI